MSRPGRPWENGRCESFIKTLKHEELDARQYRKLEELRDHVTEFIEQIYNLKRLHSALDYRSPIEFEKQHESGVAKMPATLSFLRHEEIYPLAIFIETRGPSLSPTRTHRNEFPAEYSLASCSPAALASAFPAKLFCNQGPVREEESSER
jgi:hypothetical protein